MSTAYRVSRWRKYLSYLREETLETTGSVYNKHLRVALRNGKYILYANNAIYSYDDRYTNFLTAFTIMEMQNRPIQSVLVLGIGLGSIPYMLEKTFHLSCTVTGVDIDAQVIRLVEKYTVPRLNNPIHCVCADATDYLKKTEGQVFDLICVDIFDDDIVPAAFETTAFLDQLRERLNPEHGLVFYNRLTRDETEMNITERFYYQKFKPAFTNSVHYDVGGNWILIGKPYK